MGIVGKKPTVRGSDGISCLTPASSSKSIELGALKDDRTLAGGCAFADGCVTRILPSSDVDSDIFRDVNQRQRESLGYLLEGEHNRKNCPSGS